MPPPQPPLGHRLRDAFPPPCPVPAPAHGSPGALRPSLCVISKGGLRCASPTAAGLDSDPDTERLCASRRGSCSANPHVSSAAGAYHWQCQDAPGSQHSVAQRTAEHTALSTLPWPPSSFVSAASCSLCSPLRFTSVSRFNHGEPSSALRSAGPPVVQCREVSVLVRACVSECGGVCSRFWRDALGTPPPDTPGTLATACSKKVGKPAPPLSSRPLSVQCIRSDSE